MKKLILKYLTNTISDLELNTLRNWLKKPKNQKVFESYIQDDYNLNSLYDVIDVEKAFNNVWEVAQKHTEVIPLYRRNIFKYAAVASVVLLISLTLIFNTDNSKTIEPIIANNNIQVGTDKATLTLEDGTNVTLEKGQQYISDNLESNGRDLVYTANQINQAKSKPNIAYNYLTIPRGGQYHVKLADGTEIWLNSESKLKYPTSFIDGEERKVKLVYGEAYFDVSPSTEHKGSNFKVITKNQQVEVLGTEFNIKAYQDENAIYTTLVEGKVSVENTLNKSILNPNQQSIINSGSGTIQIKEVEVNSIIGWVKGEFIFKRKSLKDIMKALSRWYDMDVVFVNKELENVVFTGTLYKKQSIEEILLLIKDTNFINTYSINDKTIILK